LDCQSNYKRKTFKYNEKCCKIFDILATSLNVLQTKLFLDLYLTKFLDTLAKEFVSCILYDMKSYGKRKL